MQRLQWKLALIAEVNGHMAAAPISLDPRSRMSADDAQYRRVTLHGRFDHAKEAYVFTTDANGAPVYHVLTPFQTDDGTLLMVDRGASPRKCSIPPPRRPVDGETQTDQACGACPMRRALFTPAPDMAHRIWYARDFGGIAAADHISLAAPVLIEADAAPNPGGWPRGGQTVVSFRNEHLSYAVTWFGLAVGLIGVYFAYHISKGGSRSGTVERPAEQCRNRSP